MRFAAVPFSSEVRRSEIGGSLNQLARTSLVVVGTVAAVSILRRVIKPRTRDAPRERLTYGEFPHQVLVVGGGFAGYMAAKTLCELTEGRDDVGVLVISKENYFTFWTMVIAEGGRDFPYDHLVVALGSQPNFFGIPGVMEHSQPLGGLADALRIRNRVIERFEEVALVSGELPDSRLTFVVIGGGTTGVETAAEIHALVHEA